MKRHFSNLSAFVICIFLLAMGSEARSQKAFSKLPSATDSTYGYTNTNPIRLKKGNAGKSIMQEMNYLSGLTTRDKQHLVLLYRSAVANPGYKEPLLKDLYNSKGGVLDKYVFLTANTKDTITLFIDIYSKGPLMLPVGLIYELP
ncbi:hypothetical protein [Chitinophaga sp. RAB17]|uniref:hypothetical protein n=1 Tax=Chitinophaga sp. RAB17 TaxID=3233049 RepID=UPI003F8F7808